jgi:hypothetical protein
MFETYLKVKKKKVPIFNYSRYPIDKYGNQNKKTPLHVLLITLFLSFLSLSIFF